MPDKIDIAVGRQVILHCSIILSDGTVVTDTFDEAPIEFVVGDGTFIESLERRLIGLCPGDDETMTLEAIDAFGFHDLDNVHDMPRHEFSKDLDLEPGTIISFTTPGGDETPGTIIEAKDDVVKVDFNHPLAGHDIKFRVKILKVTEA